MQNFQALLKGTAKSLSEIIQNITWTVAEQCSSTSGFIYCLVGKTFDTNMGAKNWSWEAPYWEIWVFGGKSWQLEGTLPLLYRTVQRNMWTIWLPYQKRNIFQAIATKNRWTCDWHSSVLTGFSYVGCWVILILIKLQMKYKIFLKIIILQTATCLLPVEACEQFCLFCFVVLFQEAWNIILK